MAHRHCRFLSAPLGASALVLVAALALGGCGTPPEDDASLSLASGAANTGTFPNLNIPPQAAAPQLTEDETQAKLASLRRAQQAQSGRVTAETPEERRRRLKLLEDEQAETLRLIEQN